MKVYVVEMMRNDYEEESWVVGVYSTIEKAENAVLNQLKQFDIFALSLELYEAMRDELEEGSDYEYWINEMKIDE